MNALTKLRNHKPLAMFRLLGEGMLRKVFLVEVKDHIVVRGHRYELRRIVF
jgi:hypothetical protein